jgi:tetrahydromethanopterin S-methyltransferase subunit G
VDDLKEFLQSEFNKIHTRLDGTDQRLNLIDARLDRIEQELIDFKRVVR